MKIWWSPLGNWGSPMRHPMKEDSNDDDFVRDSFYIAIIKCVDQKRVSKNKDYLFQVYGVVSVISGMAAIWSVTAIGKTIFQWTPLII